MKFNGDAVRGNRVNQNCQVSDGKREQSELIEKRKVKGFGCIL